jgi:hypothetical protein
VTNHQEHEEGNRIMIEPVQPRKTVQQPKPIGDHEDREDFQQWSEERGQRGRKPRNKAGGRHQKNRGRRTDE